MSIFNVELKKVVDDTYDIEIGYNMRDTQWICLFSRLGKRVSHVRQRQR